MAQNQPPTPWYRQPIRLGLVGLVLIVGGWRLTTFVPPSPAAAQLAELRRMADDPELSSRLDRVASNARREPPWRVPGRLAVLAGMVLFVAAVVGMYKAPPPREVEHELEGEAT